MDRAVRTPVALAGLFAVAGTVLSLLAPGSRGVERIPRPASAAPILPEPMATHTRPAGAVAAVPPSAPDLPSAERADRRFVRWHRAPLAGGLLVFPKSFASADGRYDLVLHLNGNTDLVEESFAYAGVNAVVVILNLGVGSGVYEDRFASPADFELFVNRVQRVMKERGLRDARLGRVALSAWSSGYGGVIKLLLFDEIFERVDGIVLLDSIYCGYVPTTKRLKPDQIEPIQRFARRAMDGKAMLSITHSEIETHTYLNARKTTDILLGALGVSRTHAAEPQPMPELVSMVGVLPTSKIEPLPPLSQAHHGSFHVRGYAGSGPVTHMLHLMQMSTTALPDLVRHWAR